MMADCDLCLASKDGPVWVNVPNFFESHMQPIISLWTQDVQQVSVPATSFLASSKVLRQAISGGNYLPVAFTAPQVIIPGVTVDALKHVAEIVTTGKCEVGGIEVLQEVEEVLYLLQILGEFESLLHEENDEEFDNTFGEVDNLREGGGEFESLLNEEVEENVEEFENTYEEVDNSRERGLIEIKTEEFSIKLEPADDTNVTDLNDKTNQVKNNHASSRSSRNSNPDNKDKAASKKSNNESEESESRQSKCKSKPIRKKKVGKVDEQIKSRFECKLCGANYGKKKSLRAHMTQHEGRYQCDMCDYKAQSPSGLKCHKQANHEGLKIFKCSQCKYSTDWIENLRKHKRGVHEGKTYACSQCSFKAEWVRVLRRHRQSAHEDVVYSCESCNYKSKVEEYLNNHKRRSCSGKQK